MKYRVVTKGINERWHLISRNAQGATFFHTPTWSEVLETTFHSWRIATSVIEFPDGNLALLPSMQQKWSLPFAGYSESMLPGVYGGPLFLYPPEAVHWQVIWDIVSKSPDMIIYGNPYLPYVGHPRAVQRLMFTHSLELNSDFAKIRARFSRGHKAAINGARKKGIAVAVAHTREEIEGYYVTYLDSLRRWGKQASGFYPRQLFHNLFLRSEYGDTIKLWVAWLDGVVIGGDWVFYHNDHAVAWHGAVHSAYIDYHTTHLVFTTAIEDACHKKFRWFDFNPSGELEGVERFKSGFGAQRIEFYAYRRLGVIGKSFRFYRYLKQKYLRRSLL